MRQQVQFLAALNRFQRLVVLRQHIHDTINGKHTQTYMIRPLQISLI